MPPKKGKKGSKKSKAKSKKSESNSIMTLLGETISKYVPPSPALFRAVQERWVLVHIKLVTWGYLNFDVKLPETANLYVIEQKIIEHHDGSIRQLTLWKEAVLPKNVLKDYSLTLRDLFRSNAEDIQSIIQFEPEHRANVLQYREDKMQRTDEVLREENVTGEPEEDSAAAAATAADLNADPLEMQVRPFLKVEPTNTAHIKHDYECVIYYDYVSHAMDCPLLLSAGRLDKRDPPQQSAVPTVGSSTNSRGSLATPIDSSAKPH